MKVPKCIITEKMVREAIELVRPLIQNEIEKSDNKVGIWIVVTDPEKQFDHHDFFNESILIECEVGKSTEKRKQNATGKAKFSWENGLPSKMGTLYPELLTPGDCVWGGSHLMETKPGKYFAVAISGFTEAKDELFSKFIIDTVRMMMSEQVLALKESDKAAIIE